MGEPDTQHCQRLFLAVLNTALADLLDELPGAGRPKRHESPERIAQRNEVWDWLRLDNPDFILICECAGLEPAYVVRKVHEHLDRLTAPGKVAAE